MGWGAGGSRDEGVLANTVAGLGWRGGRIAFSYVYIRMYFYDNYGSVDIFGGVTSL